MTLVKRRLRFVMEMPVAVDWEALRDEWLTSKRRSGQENTTRAYRRAWDDFAAWLTCDFRDVTATEVDAWIQELSDRVSAATVNARAAALSSFFFFLEVRYPHLAPTRNPFRGVERPKVSGGRAQFPTRDEVAQLLKKIPQDTVRGARDTAIILGMLMTMRRDREWLGLRWGDIRQGDEGRYFVYRCKGGKEKRAPLPEEVWRAIRRYLEMDRRWGQMEDEDFVFRAVEPGRAARLGHECRGALANSTVNKLLKHYGRLARVSEEKLHAHGLRHAGARVRDEKGQQVTEIQQLLGHESLRTTTIYLEQLRVPVDSKAAEVFDAVASVQLKMALGGDAD